MKAASCQYCGQPLYFENQLCDSCGRRVGYLPQARTLSALEPFEAKSGAWLALAAPGAAYLFCANAATGSCNWLVEAGPGELAYCQACRHNRVMPDLTAPQAQERWRKVLAAQRRLFDTLLALKLPLQTRQDHPEGLVFDILYDPYENAQGGPSVTTGHSAGLITLNLVEADDAARERLRQDLDEPYRTLLGHFRHESGHYFWDRLVRDTGALEAFRTTFGDETQPYDSALAHHYAQGPSRSDWRDHFVSAYASVHPWEDFAETWAHYLHMVDTLETAAAFGVRLNAAEGGGAVANVSDQASLDQLISAWLPLTFTVNSLNRSMGLPDLYPFLPGPTVILKLAFVHDLVRGQGAAPTADPSAAALKAMVAGLSVRVGDPTAH